MFLVNKRYYASLLNYWGIWGELNFIIKNPYGIWIQRNYVTKQLYSIITQNHSFIVGVGGNGGFGANSNQNTLQQSGNAKGTFVPFNPTTVTCMFTLLPF